METRHYDNLVDRQVKVKELEALGLVLLHDDFNADWKSGDEPHGTMVFTDVMPPTVILEPVRDLGKEIDDLKATIANFDTRLKKDVGGHVR